MRNLRMRFERTGAPETPSRTQERSCSPISCTRQAALPCGMSHAIRTRVPTSLACPRSPRCGMFLAGAVAAFVLAGCAGILGVDFDDASLDEARVLAGPTCAGPNKRCNSTCVPLGDPVFGCAADTCASCILPGALAHRCDGDRCAIAACEQGRADCDGDPSNGCETSLHSPSSCGACGLRCARGEACSDGACRAEPQSKTIPRVVSPELAGGDG